MPNRSSIRSLHRRPSLSCDVGGFCFSLCRGQKSNGHLGISARNCCTKPDSAIHSEANERREQSLIRGNRRAQPVKISAAKETHGTFRSNSPATSGRKRDQQRQGVKATIKRPSRFRLKSVKHSQA